MGSYMDNWRTMVERHSVCERCGRRIDPFPLTGLCLRCCEALNLGEPEVERYRAALQQIADGDFCSTEGIGSEFARAVRARARLALQPQLGTGREDPTQGAV